MPKEGINAGDPLIDMITNQLDANDFKWKLTKGSGSQKGDGDIHINNLATNIAIDGKYVSKEPVNPRLIYTEINKIKRQAHSCDRQGVIITNCSNDLVVSMTLDTFLSILETTKQLQN